MSLQVWLPMTKDLRQQGLSDVTVTNNGATFNSSGKLGGCYQFGTAASGIEIPKTSMTSFSEASVSFWVKILSWNTSYCTLFQAGTSSRNWTDYIFGILRNGTNSTLCFTIGDTSSTTTSACQTSTLNLNEWYHMTFTYQSGKMKIYLNGNLDKEYTTSHVPSFNKITKISLGQANDNLYQSNCLMNDVRIYDHCLSPMEVKELSKGLVLHYPLNRQGWGQENLFRWSNNATGMTLYDYQNKGSFTQFANSLTFDPSTTVGKKYTISFWAKSPNGTTSLLLYNSNGKPEYFNFSTTLTGNLGTEWQFFKYTVTNTQYTGSDASTNTSIWKRIEIYAPNQMKVQVKQIKVEEGEIATPWSPNSADSLYTAMGLNSLIEYDTSGFCNNGTRTGTFDWTSNTPKYEVSTKFNGAEKISANSLPSEVQSVSFWVKVPTIPSGYRICYVDSGTQTSIGFYNGNSFITSCTVNANVVLLGTTFKANEWNHIVLVKTGTNTRNVYCNGVLLTSSGTNSWVHNGGNLSLGWRDYASGNAGWFNGQLCDFRAYATALSADDVKSLYQNSAYIDSSGNVYGAVHSEV